MSRRHLLLLCGLAACAKPGPVRDAWEPPLVEVPFHETHGGGAILGAEKATTVAYATTSPAETLDLFLPVHGTKPYPVVFRIHSGGFDEGSALFVETDHAAERIVAAGYAIVAMNYRLTTEAPFPAAARDVKAAVRFVRANAARWDLDPQRFAAWGEGTGGWFAAMLGVTGDQPTVFDDPSLGNASVSSAVQAVVDWYGPTDFATADGQNAARPPLPCVDTYRRHGGAGTPESRWLCGNRESSLGDPQCAAAVRDANVVHYVATAKHLPDFAIAHGADDCELPYAQSVELYEALRKRDATASYHRTSRAIHDDPIIESVETARALETLATAFRP